MDIRTSHASTLLETLDAYIILTDPEGRIETINDRVEEVFGYANSEVQGARIEEVFRPEEHRVEARRWFRELEAGERAPGEFPSDYEQPWVTEDGTTRWVAWSNTVVTDSGTTVEGVLGTGIDVTERRRMTEELEGQRAQLQAILETAVDGIITIDERGRIQSFNEAAEEIFGYRAEEVRGKKVNVLMPPPYRNEHDDYMQRYMDTGEAHIIGTGREVTGLRKDGSTFPLRLAVSEVDVQREGRLFTGFVHDLSERRRLEQEVLRAADEERQHIAQELHDGLGSMLGGMRLMAETIAKELRQEEEPHAEEVAKLARYLSEADDLARRLARGMRPTDFEAGGLPAALERMALRLEDQYQVRAELEMADGLEVDDDTTAAHLFRIAQEAARNGIHHGEADRIQMQMGAPDGHLHLIVRDDGCGFPDDFDLGEEDGIGIRSMRYRARICGGELRMHSSEEGVTVACRIPRQERRTG